MLNCNLVSKYILHQLSQTGYSRYVPYVSRILFLKNRFNKEYVGKICSRTNRTQEELTKDAQTYIKNIHSLVYSKASEILSKKKYVDDDDVENILNIVKKEMGDGKDDIFLQKCD